MSKTQVMRGLFGLAAILATTPAAADITVNFHLTWKDFNATQVQVTLGTEANGVTIELQTQFLTMTGPRSAQGTFVFPDSDAAAEGGTASYGATMGIASCANFDECINNNYDPGNNSPGIFLNLSSTGTVSAAAGQTVDFNIDLPSFFGTVTGQLALPPGTPPVTGYVYTTGANSSTIYNDSVDYNDDELLTPNSDGTYGFSVRNGGQPAFDDVIVALPSGAVSRIVYPQIPATAAGQTSTISLPASGLVYVQGSVDFGTAVQSASMITYHLTLEGTDAALRYTPGASSGTYDGLFAPQPTDYTFLQLSSCDNFYSCSPGWSSFVPLQTLDLSSVGGQSVRRDMQPHPTFATLAGTITVPGLTLQGGTAYVQASNPDGQFTLTQFSFGADGKIPDGTVVGQSPNAQVLIYPQIAECSQLVVRVFDVAIGPGTNTQSFAFNVTPAQPDTSIQLNLALKGWNNSNASYFLSGEWVGGSTLQFCNGPTDFFYSGFVYGPQSNATLTNFGQPVHPEPGLWKFSYQGTDLIPIGNGSQQSSTFQPAQQVLVADSGATALTFPSSGEELVGSIDTSGWQLGPNDEANIAVFAITQDYSGYDGTSFFSFGPPPGNQAPLDLTVLAGTSLQPAGLVSGASYFIAGPDGNVLGFSNWGLNATVDLGSYTPGTKSLPGLSSIQIGGIGNWLLSFRPPAGSQQPAIAVNYFNSGLFFGSSSETAVDTTKIPAGSYPSGISVTTSYNDSSGQYQSNSYSLGAEVAAGDLLVATVNSPILVQRTPAPGTICPAGSSDDAIATTQVSLASDLTQLKSLTIGGTPVKLGGTSFSAQSVLPLGKWPLEIVATAASGDRTSWKRYYNVPVAMSSSGFLGALVPDGQSPPAPAAGIKLGGNVKLQLAVTTCGHPADDTKAYALQPSLVEVSRAGKDLSLATIDPGAEDADGDIDFKYNGQGTWFLNLQTKLLGAGTFVMKIQSPDGSLWDALLVVKP